jgi:tripartite-type tricarboxylate transporter receptor subunit TctC
MTAKACAIVSALLIGMLAAAPTATDAADFYAGKTITMMVHTTPGGGYDTYVRLLARHLGRHISGNPEFVVINKPGAAGLLAANYAGKIAPRDGTFLAMMQEALLLDEALGAPGLQTSMHDFNWIGNLSQSNNVIVTWTSSQVKTIGDARKRVATIGASGSGGTAAQVPAIINALLGTRFKIVLGYAGGAPINLAMERGEVDGRGASTWATYKTTSQAQIQGGKFNVLIQIGLRPEPELPGVPLLTDLVKGDPTKERAARFVSLALSLSRPIAAPPDVPPDRIAMLREAFAATMKDPAFRADAHKLGAAVDPMPGSQVQEIVNEVLRTPPPVIAVIKAALGASAAPR